VAVVAAAAAAAATEAADRRTDRQTRELSSRQVAMQGEARRRRWCYSATEGADDLTAVTDR
jgi:hypothetical protein